MCNFSRNLIQISMGYEITLRFPNRNASVISVILRGVSKLKRANSTGSIIKLGGKRRRPWAVKVTAGWTDDGRQIQKYLSYHEKRGDAQIALAEYNKNPYDIDAARITFADIYERWSEIEYKKLAPKTVTGYKSAYKHCKVLHNKVFKEIRKNHLQSVVDEIEAPSMKEVTKFLFNKSYRFAMENDIVQKDYSQFVELPKRDKPKEKIPFTEEEIKFLWDNIENIKYADFTLILLYTGMRVGELIDIDKSDIHIEERYMIGGSKTDAGKNRVIPIHKRIVPLIEKRMNEHNNEWLFTNKRGLRLKYSPFMKYHWKNIVECLGVEHTPHDTRHTFVSEMDRLGVNKVILKRIVGHSNSDITEHYTHKNLPELIDAVDKIEW